MESRTIFFNGPKGHRWVTAPAPTLKANSILATSSMPDEKVQNRRCFFGSLNALRSRLERHGVTPNDVRKYYAKWFGVERLSQCTQQHWAVAAAEVQAMVQSQELFLDRVSRFKTEWKGESNV